MTPPKGSPARETLKQEIARQYQAGRTLDRISETLPYGRTTIGNLLQEAGVKPRPTGIPGFLEKMSPEAREAFIDDVVRQYRAGASIPEIAATTGKAHCTIWKLLVKVNEPRRRQHGGRRAS